MQIPWGTSVPGKARKRPGRLCGLSPGDEVGEVTVSRSQGLVGPGRLGQAFGKALVEGILWINRKDPERQCNSRKAF